MSLLVTVLLWVLAIGTGLMAGVYFAFSAFIMAALDRIGAARAIAAMNAINLVILRSAFMPLFIGTSIGAAVMAVVALLQWDGSAAAFALAGAALYLVGMTVVTMAFNVPLNNELAAIDPDAAESAPVWSRYLANWTAWNHLRTAASALASIAFVASLCTR